MHHVVCLSTPQLSLVLIVPAHGWMARLSCAGWLVLQWNGLWAFTAPLWWVPVRGAYTNFRDRLIDWLIYRLVNRSIASFLAYLLPLFLRWLIHWWLMLMLMMMVVMMLMLMMMMMMMMCWGPHYRRMSRAERRQHLNEQYFFECRCSACSQDVERELYFEVRHVTSLLSHHIHSRQLSMPRETKQIINENNWKKKLLTMCECKKQFQNLWRQSSD